MKHYDYLVVGAGLFGATFAYEAQREERKYLLSISAITLPVTFIPRK